MSQTSDTIETVLLFEDFSDWDTIVYSDYYGGAKAKTNGQKDGQLLFESVDFADKDNVEIQFDAQIQNGSFEEWGAAYGDVFRVEFVDQDGTVHLLDEFSGTGQTLTGSVTGQLLTGTNTTFSYTLPDSITGGQLRFTSDISAKGERIAIDNVSITGEEPAPEGQVVIDFETLGDGTALSAGDNGVLQFDGVSFEATKKNATVADDAMIFDAANPTGGDTDLFQPASGNVLIISEDHDASDPDDNWAGGTITARFDQPSTLVAIDMLDTEEPGGTIDMFDADGALLATVNVPGINDGGIQTVSLGNTQGVSTMVITLSGSGAVDCLRYVPDEDDPEPSTVVAEDDTAQIELFDLFNPDGFATVGNVYDNDFDPDIAGGGTGGIDFVVTQVTGTTTDDIVDADGFFGWVDADNGGQIRVNTDGSIQIRDDDGVLQDALSNLPVLTTSISYEIVDDTGAVDDALISITIANLGGPGD